MATKTIDEIIASVSSRRPDINLGTEINTSAEVYNNTNNRDCYSHSYTFQQSNANVEGPSALFSSPSASHSVSERKEVRENGLAFGKESKSGPKTFQQRKVTTQDYIVGVWVGINNIRVGDRTNRVAAYINLMSEDDKKYSMYYRSNLTSAHDEQRRQIIKSDNKPLLSVLDEFVSEFGRDCLIGRLKLNPRKYKITDEHRKAHKHALICLYPNGTDWSARLYLLGEYYDIDISNSNLIGQQSEYYNAIGIWERDFGETE